MVEELKACASLAAQYKEHEDPFLLVELQEMAQELFLDHGQTLVEAVESEDRRIGAFVRRIEREGASNLHQSMAQAFIRHALSGEHDGTDQTVRTP